MLQFSGVILLLSGQSPAYLLFLFIIVFDVIYMLLPLFVLCSKIALKKPCLFSSLERFFGISRVNSSDPG